MLILLYNINMLVDTRKQESKQEFNPNVINKEQPAIAGVGQKILFAIICILTIGLFAIYLITKKNWFNKLQVKANEATSNIDVQLKKRKDTLIKLFDATKSSMKFEKGVMTDITALRSANVGSKNFNKSNALMDKVGGKLVATLENYPQLQSANAVKTLMESADYIEREIASARRLYNSVVTQFNQDLYAFPASVVAARMKLYNLPLYVASAEDKKDVNLSIDL